MTSKNRPKHVPTEPELVLEAQAVKDLEPDSATADQARGGKNYTRNMTATC